ncbi:UNVERIFIED_CONTAM: hypothetical protein HDU68_000566 [Siphonaria sp. JEL0065]|nr:hypothetical protein HDU68_000566 [Siphonaria sp. JEL0065]
MSWLTPPAQDAPLKAHLLYWFTLCVVGSLVIAEAIALGFIGGSLLNLTNTASNLLTTQASNALASSIVSNSAQLFEDVLQNILYGVTATAVATGDAFRADYTTGPELSFYGTEAYLDSPKKQPLTENQFPGMTISETHSVWILANSVSTTPPTLTADQQDTLNKVAHVDLFMRPIYLRNNEILSVQIGFENGIFKSYPGTGDNLSQGPYDPKNRSWYIAGKSNQATNTSYMVAAPYLSAFGRGWVMTTAKAFYNKNTGAFLGVVSIQSQLSEFSKLLKSYTYGNSSVAIFTADTAGLMLASTKINFNNTSPGAVAFSYLDTTSPSLSTSFWRDTILKTASTGISTQSSAYGSATYTDPVTNVAYLVLWKTLSIYNSDTAAKSQTPSWIAVGAVPISKVQDSVAVATTNLKQSVPFSIGISIALFVATLGIVLVLVTFFAKQIVKPLTKLSEESTRVSNNIGGKDLWEGVGGGSSREEVSGVDEMDAFQESFYSMVKIIREGSVHRSTKQGDMGDNSVFMLKNGELPEWDPKAQDSNVVELLPDTPPQYQEFQREEQQPKPQATYGSFVPGS